VTERIETFGRVHLDECTRVLVSAFNSEPWNDTWTLETARQELAWTMGVPGFAGLVSLEGQVLAFATGWREPDDRREVFFLKTFCVSPNAQGTGVGGRLLARLEEYLGESGVNTMYLVTHRGTPAEGFYRKHGYTVNPEDVVMTREW
jgi:GNAT superfamily N-acetyltransferase